jgi:fructose-bisphosphate aldolase class II
MLTNFNDMLHRAYASHYAIGSFNGYNYETFRGIIEANKKAGNRPAIVAFGAKYLPNMSVQEAHSMVSAIDLEVNEGAPAAEEMQICLHLDHCKDLKVIRDAIDAGFGSVMYDGSALPFEENIANTKEVVKWAHEKGVSVEAELGSLAAGEASHEGEKTDRQIYTDPLKAREFVDRTGTDALAVSIGTVHGLYKGTPKVRVDILKTINQAVGIPLVLHGGSGTPEDVIRACIRNGIAKINVNTEISMYTVEHLTKVLQSQQPHFSVLSLEARKAVEEVVTKYISFFGEV